MSMDNSRVIQGVYLLAGKAHIDKISYSEALRLALLGSHRQPYFHSASRVSVGCL